MIRIKKIGYQKFFSETWNIVDFITIVFSFIVIGLYFLRKFAVIELTKKISKTRGNEFIPIERIQQINQYYDYSVSITVFTSILKLCKLLR